MTYEMYRLVFIVGAALSGAMLALAVILFFTLKIPSVIGNLTGATARKTIEKMRSQSAEAADGAGKSGSAGQRDVVTDRISVSGRLQKRAHLTAGAMETEKLGTQRLSKEAAASAANETTVLLPPAAETTLLSTGNSETTLLAPEMSPAVPINSNVQFQIEYELTYIHSDEVIA